MWVVLVIAALLPSRRDLVFDHAQRGRYQQAVSLITSARETGAPIAAAEYTVAINACGKAGDVSTALEVLSLLEDDIERSGEPPSSGHAKAFTSAMSACGREARWQTALTLLDRMRGLGLSPDTRAWNAALSACARAGKVQPMLDGLKTMCKEGVAHDKASFTIAIDGCARAGLTSEALRLFGRMGRDGAPEADAVCYNAAIAACARGGLWEEAIKLLSQMTKVGLRPTVEGVSSAMTACSNARQWQMALRLFERLDRIGLEPDATAFSTAITAISRSEPVCYGQALGLFRRMRRRGVERDAVAYNAMFHACSQARRTGHAIRLRTLMRLERVRPTSISYSVMLQLLWHRSDEAASILDEAMSLPGSFQQCLQVVRAPAQAAVTRSTGSSMSGTQWTLDLHKFSPGAAVALVLWVVSKIIKLEVSGQPLPVYFAIITGWGKHNDNGPDIGRERGAVRRAVLEAIRICRLPMVHSSGNAPSAVEERLPSTKANPGLVELDMGRFGQWTDIAIRSGLIRGYFAHGDRLLVDVSRFAQSILTITNGSAQTSETDVTREPSATLGHQPR